MYDYPQTPKNNRSVETSFQPLRPTYATKGKSDAGQGRTWVVTSGKDILALILPNYEPKANCSATVEPFPTTHFTRLGQARQRNCTLKYTSIIKHHRWSEISWLCFISKRPSRQNKWIKQNRLFGQRDTDRQRPWNQGPNQPRSSIWPNRTLILLIFYPVVDLWHAGFSINIFCT